MLPATIQPSSSEGHLQPQGFFRESMNENTGCVLLKADFGKTQSFKVKIIFLFFKYRTKIFNIELILALNLEKSAPAFSVGDISKPTFVSWIWNYSSVWHWTAPGWQQPLTFHRFSAEWCDIARRSIRHDCHHLSVLFVQVAPGPNRYWTVTETHKCEWHKLSCSNCFCLS